VTIHRVALILLCASSCLAQRSPADTGAPEVTVSCTAGKWTLAGRRNTIEFEPSNFAITVHADPRAGK
jgi:hypothetical protein